MKSTWLKRLRAQNKAIKKGDIPGEIFDAIESGIVNSFGSGIQYGYPCTDIAVTVTDINYNGESVWKNKDVDKLNNQLRKYKKRLQDRHKSNESIRFDSIQENYDSSDEDNLDIVIERTKKFYIKPIGRLRVAHILPVMGVI